MNFETFISKVNAVIAKSGEKTKAKFTHDNDSGKHYAVCNNGVTFIGNNDSLSVTVKWGSGHTAKATI